MPFIYEDYDSLPYIDSSSTPEQLAAASQILAAEVSSQDTSSLHPSIPTTYSPQYSELLTTSHDALAANGKARAPGEGIDLSRYEEPSAPEDAHDRDAWRGTLQSAYFSESYLAQRHLNLSLLEKYGKNAWLIGNSQVEDELKALEREVDTAQRELQAVEAERRRNQEAAKGELEGLEETWKATVGRAIEAEVAAEMLRRQVLDKRRGA